MVPVMKRILHYIFIPIFWTMPLSADLNLSLKEQMFIQEHPVISVQNERDWEPFNYMTDNQPTGHSIDYMKLLASKVGLEIEFVQGHSWKQYLEMLKSGHLDVLVNIAKTPEREQFFSYTPEYHKILSSLYVREENVKKYTSLKDLEGKTVSVVQGMIGESVLRKNYPKINISPAKTSLDALKAVIYGRVDGVVQSNAVGNRLIKKYHLENIRPVFEINDPKFNMHLHLATRKQNSVLRDILEKGMLSITDDELARLQQKHFHSKQHTSIRLSNSEKQYLDRQKTIRICINPDNLPFGKNENGRYVGIGAEFMKIVQEQLQLTTRLVETENWKSTLKVVQKGECDLIPFIAETEERKSYLEFTEKYLEIPIVLAVHQQTPFIDDVRKLHSKKVAIVKGYAFQTLLKTKYPNLEAIPVDSLEEGLQLVEQKKVFAHVDLLASITRYVQMNFIEGIKIGGKLDEKIEISMATTKPERMLVPIINKVIKDITEEKRQEILSRWIKITYEQVHDYQTIKWITGIFLIIFLLGVLRQQILRKYNRRLEERIKKELELSRKKDNLIFQQSKMAALGEMMGFIAHQWRQPLAELSMGQNILLGKAEYQKLSQEEAVSLIKKEQEIIRFMSKTIDTFQNFYQKNNTTGPFNLYSAYLDAKEVLSNTLSLNSIKLQEEIDPKLEIFGNKNDLSQVLFSIMQNSIYFLKKRKINPARMCVSIFANDTSLILEIADNAGSVEEKELPHLFDYGYSKRDGETPSTGLGLYIAQLIINEKFHGHIHAANTDGGLKITISLPAKNPCWIPT